MGIFPQPYNEDLDRTLCAFNKVERHVLKCVVISAVLFCFCIVLVGFVFWWLVVLVGSVVVVVQIKTVYGSWCCTLEKKVIFILFNADKRDSLKILRPHRIARF